MASGTLLYDVKKQAWSDETLKTFSIEKTELPERKWSGEKAGMLSAKVSEELGLNEGVAVIVGGQDQKCAALGAGIGRDTVFVSLGTATAVSKIWYYPNFDDQMKIPVFSYFIKNKWVTEGVIGTSGVTLKWLKNDLFSGESLENINDRIQSCGYISNDLFFYPRFMGVCSPNWYTDGCGCIYGLNLVTKRSEIAAALYEGIAFQIKHNLDLITAKVYISALIVFGGGSKSEILCQIIADITGIKVKVNDSPETASRGAAILAGIGCGVFSQLLIEDAPATFRKEFIPNADKHKQYKDKYKRFCAVDKKLWTSN